MHNLLVDSLFLLHLTLAFTPQRTKVTKKNLPPIDPPTLMIPPRPSLLVKRNEDGEKTIPVPNDGSYRKNLSFYNELLHSVKRRQGSRVVTKMRVKSYQINIMG